MGYWHSAFINLPILYKNFELLFKYIIILFIKIQQGIIKEIFFLEY